MSRLIAVRVSDDLAMRIESRALVRKQSKTAVILEAIEQSFSSAALNQPLNPLARQLCSYTEYDAVSGESYRCALPAHSDIVKHRRGERIV